MMSIILRRSLSCLAPRRALTASLSSIENVLYNKHPLPSQNDAVVHRDVGMMGFLARRDRSLGFHVKSGQLDFKASTAWHAESAVDDYVVEDDGLDISKLGISPEIISALNRKGIFKLFPIQRAVLEPAMQGRDMIGRARTGTGKTLAFGIPILDKIIQFNAKHGFVLF